MKPALSRACASHPKIACEGERQKRKSPKENNRIEARELAFRGRKDGHYPIFVLGQFRHPTQAVKVSVEANQVIMNVIVKSRNTP
jgi:hypothetical protein